MAVRQSRPHVRAPEPTGRVQLGRLAITSHAPTSSPLARITRAREEAGRQLSKIRDVVAWQSTMARLDAEERVAKERFETRRLIPPEIVDYTRSLPRFWADSGP